MTTIKKLEAVQAKMEAVLAHLEAFPSDLKPAHVTKATTKLTKLNSSVKDMIEVKKGKKSKKPVKLNDYIIFANTVRADVMKQLGKSAGMADVAREIGRMWREKKAALVGDSAPAKPAPKIRKTKA